TLFRSNMPIQDFVNIVAAQNGINIATDKKIEKEFSFFVNKKISGKVNVEVLAELLESNGFVLQKQNKDFYVIKSKEEILINQIEIFTIEHADTKKVKEQADLILQSYYKQIKKVTTTTKDKKFTPMEERDDTAGNVEIKETEEKQEYAVNIINNKSIAVTYKDQFVPEVVRKIIQAIDKKPVRIKVHAKIYEVNTNDLKQFGAEYGINAQLGDFRLGANVNPQNGLIALGATETPKTPLDISAMINALEKNGSAKIKAEPSVFIYEGKKARLIDGKTYPIQSESTTVSNQNTTSTTTYTYQDTGITFDLSFLEYRSEMIYLTMNLTITNVEEFDAEKNQIITIKRQLNEDLLIKPGEQIHLAGLTRKSESSSTGGIPVLQDIPLIGGMFTFENTKNEENQLMILIKAELISDNINMPMKKALEN
ncbi:MAG: hypothetical protein RBR70_12790, partial [Arcobacter sp.]|uniref:type II secretion system protein GspD n=1 Tax=Arcobacter sp. TaxID=1872629 RepID=UPI002A75416B